jgi:hypothetical protein
MKCFVNLIEDEFSDFFELMKKVDKKELQRIAFDDLWYLYKPGDIVLSHANGHERAYIVHSISGGRAVVSDVEAYNDLETVYDAFRGRSGRDGADAYNSDDEYVARRDRARRREEVIVVDRNRGDRRFEVSGSIGHYNPISLSCFYLDFNGVYVAPCQQNLTVGQYSGLKSISELSVRPAFLDSNAKATIERLQNRGERLISLKGHKLYYGLAARTADEIAGEVYIDPQTGYSENGRWRRHNPEFGVLTRRLPHLAEYTFRYRRVKRNALSRIHERSRSRSRVRTEVDDDIEADRTDEFLRSHSALLSPVNPEEDSLSAEQLQLLPGEVYGYVFRSRKWSKFSAKTLKTDFLPLTVSRFSGC